MSDDGGSSGDDLDNEEEEDLSDEENSDEENIVGGAHFSEEFVSSLEEYSIPWMTKEECIGLICERTKILEESTSSTTKTTSDTEEEVMISGFGKKRVVMTNADPAIVTKLIESYRSHYPKELKDMFKGTRHMFMEDIAKQELKERQLPLWIIRSYYISHDRKAYYKINPNKCTNIDELLEV